MNDPTKIELLEKLLKVLPTDRGMKFLLSLSDEDLKTLLVTVRE
jgi:hypothetical protein